VNETLSTVLVEVEGVPVIPESAPVIVFVPENAVQNGETIGAVLRDGSTRATDDIVSECAGGDRRHTCGGSSRGQGAAKGAGGNVAREHAVREGGG